MVMSPNSDDGKYATFVLPVLTHSQSTYTHTAYCVYVYILEQWLFLFDKFSRRAVDNGWLGYVTVFAASSLGGCIIYSYLEYVNIVCV